VIALIQRVLRAEVTVPAPDGPPGHHGPARECAGRIGPGMLVMVCAEPADTDVQAVKLVDKLLKLRVFADMAGKMNRSVQDIGGGLLIVSQFTLAADTSGGNRPSFAGAAPPAQGRMLYDTVVQLARSRHPSVEQGRFGADMQVELVNDGPVTLPLVVR
jgi:D-tyrosyl-tRNA(Tyr) deacylase